MFYKTLNKKWLLSIVILFALIISVFSLISPLVNTNTSISKQNNVKDSTTQGPIRVLPKNNVQTNTLKTSNQKTTSIKDKASLSNTNTPTTDLSNPATLSTNQPMALSTVSTVSNCYSSQNYNMTAGSNYNWYNVTTIGTALGLNGVDDGAASLALPFNFPFYNGIFNTVYISSNGWLSFNNTSPTSYSNPSFPDAYDNYVIAPFWYDLIVTSGYDVYGYTTSSYAVIEFQNTIYFSNDAFAGTFEVVLYSNGSISFNYQNMGTEVGIPTVGLNSGYNLTLFNTYTTDLSNVVNFTISFTPLTINYPDLAVCLSTPINVIINSTQTVSTTVFNAGNENETNIPFSLILNGNIVASTTISSLDSGSSYSLSYSWSPTLVGYYNFTGYAVPVQNETIITNNVASQGIPVNGPIQPSIGGYLEWIYNVTTEIDIFNFTFTNWVSTDIINTSLTVNRLNPNTGIVYENDFYWMEIDVWNRTVVNSDMWWTSSSFVNWIQPLLSVGDQISVWTDNNAQVLSQTTLNWQGNVYNVTEISFNDGGTSYGYYDNNTGLLLYMSGAESGFLNATNLLSINSVSLSSLLIPEISDNGSVNYYQGATGNYIDWTIIGQNPDVYTITDNNGTIVSTGNWYNNTPIMFNVDGLIAGSYFYTITANDTFGHTVTDQVYVYSNGPSIIDYGSVNYDPGSTGNYITWVGTAYSPSTYTIIDNNYTTVASGFWYSNSQITFNVDGLSIGNYWYQITLNDTYGNSIADIVYVSVAISPPTVYDYGGVSYTQGQTGNQIEWVGTSNYPSTYSIMDYNYNTVASGNWNSGVPIYFNVDGLSPGTYWYQISLMDTYGNTVSDTVYVYVSNSLPTIIDNVSGSLNYILGTTGHYVSWTGTSNYPDSFTVTDENYNIIAFGTWNSNVPVIINVDGLSQGSHYYTMEMQDYYGNSVYDTVNINVYSPTANPLSHPSDFSYNQGTTGNSIVWNVNLQGSTYHYSITNNGAPVVTNVASSSKSIVQNVDGLSVGTYNYTIDLIDASGIHWYDSVTVTVNPAQSSISSTSSTDSSSSGTTIHTSPGFEMFFLIAGLGTIYLYKKRRF